MARQTLSNPNASPSDIERMHLRQLDQQRQLIRSAPPLAPDTARRGKESQGAQDLRRQLLEVRKRKGDGM